MKYKILFLLSLSFFQLQFSQVENDSLSNNLNDDTLEDIKWLSSKIVKLRVFPDENDVMNKSILEVGGDILLVSQFTLHASTKKGNRPSYIRAAKNDVAEPLYDKFTEELSKWMNKTIQTGIFGADMQVELINDGPVTIIIDTKLKE